MPSAGPAGSSSGGGPAQPWGAAGESSRAGRHVTLPSARRGLSQRRLSCVHAMASTCSRQSPVLINPAAPARSPALGSRAGQAPRDLGLARPQLPGATDAALTTAPLSPTAPGP